MQSPRQAVPHDDAPCTALRFTPEQSPVFLTCEIVLCGLWSLVKTLGQGQEGFLKKERCRKGEETIMGTSEVFLGQLDGSAV